MSIKKDSLEEQMAQSIFYNLSILRMAVKTTAEFDDILCNTMFLKSNTKTFIHTTHFLFNIIDAKEFKAKFYWPISEKKYENAYRSSSIDFINNLIDKYHLTHEKVKMPFVIHPHGKKFMSVMLDVIMLASKEVMRRRSFPTGKSFDIEQVTEACSNLQTAENELVATIQSESQHIQTKTAAIKKVIDRVYPQNEFPMTFEEFIAAWNEYNTTRLKEINDRNEAMQSVYQKTNELVQRANQMLQSQTYEAFAPSPESIREVAEFYENVGEQNLEPINDHNLNLSWLISQLNLVLPVIVNYVLNYQVDPSNTSSDEQKTLLQYSSELNKTEKKIAKVCAHWRSTIPALIDKFKKAKEDRERKKREATTPEELAELDVLKKVKRQQEVEKFKALLEPVYYFDATKECLKQVAVQKNRLALLHGEDGNENLVNETKVYRSIQSTLANKSSHHSKIKEMGPPKQLRRRFDPMEMLEKANQTSSSRGDLNVTKRVGNALRASAPKFSSTLLSPDLRQPQFNFSIYSLIGNGSPLNEPSILGSIGDLRLSDQPRTPLSAINVQNGTQDQLKLQANPKPNQTCSTQIKLINDTMETSENKTESTIKLAKQNSDSAVDSFSSGWMVNDENLFNVSDTLLENVID